MDSATCDLRDRPRVSRRPGTADRHSAGGWDLWQRRLTAVFSPHHTFFPDDTIFSAAFEAFDGERPDRIPAAARAQTHARREGMVAVRGEPAFDAGGDLGDSLVADAKLRGELLLRFARDDMPFVDCTIAP